MNKIATKEKERRAYDPLESSDSDGSTDTASRERLSWRQNPAVNLSDWSIHIIPEEGISRAASDEDVFQELKGDVAGGDESGCTGVDLTGQKKAWRDPFGEIYHVHKTILAATSDYFYNLFHTSIDTQERSSQCSVIRLEPEACENFPLFLDYIYNPNIPTARGRKKNNYSLLCTENASAMRYLSNYFSIRELFRASSKFIKDDMDPTNFLVYLEGSHIFSDALLRETVIKFCAGHLDHLDEADLIQVPPDTFDEVLKFFLKKHWNASDDRYFSMKLVSYLEAHPEFHETVTFRSLMKEETENLSEELGASEQQTQRPQLKSLHPKAAIRFLQLERVMTAYPWFRDHCAQVCSTYWQRIPLWNESCRLPPDLSDKVHKDALSRARIEIESLQWFVFDLLRSSFDEMDRKNENFFRSFIYTSRLMRRMTGEMEAFRSEEFVSKHRNTLPKRITVSDSGIDLVNDSPYEFIGSRSGCCAYSNGDFMISRFAREEGAQLKWYFSWPSPEGDPSHDLIFYENDENVDTVPSTGWKNFEVRRTWAEGPPIVNVGVAPTPPR